MKKNRLLYLIPNDWYFGLHFIELAKAAQDAGFEVLIATNTMNGVGALEKWGFKVFSIPFSVQNIHPFNDLKLIKNIIQLYRREKPTLVHHVALKAVLYGSLASRIAGIPKVINSFMGLGYVFTDKTAKAIILRSIISPALKYALAISNSNPIFMNIDDREYFVQKGIIPKSKGIVKRIVGVDTSKYIASPERQGENIVLLPARLLWTKGIGEFIKAARIIKRTHKAVRFVLVGKIDKGNPSNISEKQINTWQKEGIVEWWGFRNDMPEVFASSHVVVLPSYREGLGMVLLEAGACGRAVVATDVPGCRDVVKDGENGFLVPVGDPQSLSRAISILIENPGLRKEMGERGVKFVEKEYELRRTRRGVLGIYEGVS